MSDATAAHAVKAIGAFCGRMIRAIRSADHGDKPVVDMADLIIATRALRLHNRSQAGTEAYTRVHTILKEGMRNA